MSVYPKDELEDQKNYLRHTNSSLDVMLFDKTRPVPFRILDLVNLLHPVAVNNQTFCNVLGIDRPAMRLALARLSVEGKIKRNNGRVSRNPEYLKSLRPEDYKEDPQWKALCQAVIQAKGLGNYPVLTSVREEGQKKAALQRITLRMAPDSVRALDALGAFQDLNWWATKLPALVAKAITPTYRTWLTQLKSFNQVDFHNVEASCSAIALGALRLHQHLIAEGESGLRSIPAYITSEISKGTWCDPGTNGELNRSVISMNDLLDYNSQPLLIDTLDPPDEDFESVVPIQMGAHLKRSKL